MKKIFAKKNEIQVKALNSWKNSKYNSILAMCTGSGKSRCGVLAAKHVVKDNPKAKILLVVPTETLRDQNWLEEFEKWGAKGIYDKNLDRKCYVSISKIEKEKYDLVILDETHRITEKSSSFFDQNKVGKILGLTATPPEDDEKKDILYKKLKLKISFDYPLDTGVKDGVVAPFKIKVIELNLSKKRDFKVTTKTNKKGYITSEQARYDSLTRVIQKMQYSGKPVPKFLYLNRMRFLYDLPSKTELAKKIKSSQFKKSDRFLIFCGSISQANELCKYRYHSKTDDTDLNKLKTGKIKRLSCVKSLNEGENIPNLDSALIVQLSSKKLDLIQRLGRIIRVREGHTATVYILSVLNTQDEKWTAKALEDFDPSSIEYINVKNLKL